MEEKYIDQQQEQIKDSKKAHLQCNQNVIKNTVLDKQLRSESQSAERLDELIERFPRLEHPSILKLVRQCLSPTNRLSSSLQIGAIINKMIQAAHSCCPLAYSLA